MPLAKIRNRVSNSAEIVDDGISGDTQAFLDQSRPDHPGIVGELEDLSGDRAREGDREFIGKVRTRPPAKFLPGKLEACMFRGLQSDGLAERGDALAVDLGQCKAGVRSANVSDGNPLHPSRPVGFDRSITRQLTGAGVGASAIGLAPIRAS